MRRTRSEWNRCGPSIAFAVQKRTRLSPNSWRGLASRWTAVSGFVRSDTADDVFQDVLAKQHRERSRLLTFDRDLRHDVVTIPGDPDRLGENGSFWYLLGPVNRLTDVSPADRVRLIVTFDES